MLLTDRMQVTLQLANALARVVRLQAPKSSTTETRFPPKLGIYLHTSTEKSTFAICEGATFQGVENVWWSKLCQLRAGPMDEFGFQGKRAIVVGMRDKYHDNAVCSFA
jgi:hypothetical protein